MFIGIGLMIGSGNVVAVVAAGGGELLTDEADALLADQADEQLADET